MKEMGEKYNLPPHVIEKIVETPWRTMQEEAGKLSREKLQAKDYPVFYHKHLGVFQTNDRRINRIRKKKDK